MSQGLAVKPHPNTAHRKTLTNRGERTFLSSGVAGRAREYYNMTFAKDQLTYSEPETEI